jgi:hypothetical protein
MEREELVKIYIKKAEEGMNIYDIRKQLQYKNIPEEEIKIILGIVDNYILNKALTKSHSTKANELFWVGVLLTTAGLIITFGSFLGIIHTGDSFILMYGPVISGIAAIFSSGRGSKVGKFRRNK